MRFNRGRLGLVLAGTAGGIVIGQVWPPAAALIATLVLVAVVVLMAAYDAGRAQERKRGQTEEP